MKQKIIFLFRKTILQKNGNFAHPMRAFVECKDDRQSV
jgi:hypothetical protein